MTLVKEYLEEVKMIAGNIDHTVIEEMVDLLVEIRRRQGRLFFLGVGGGAGNASHAVNDARKIAGIESYFPGDNVSELTARINDEGWETAFAAWLKVSHLRAGDGVFVFSVGGGDPVKNISVNLVKALDYAREVGAKILGIVGRDGGHTARVGDTCLVIPTVNSSRVTAHTESFQSVIWHLIISHPKIKVAEMKWESINQDK
jgi:D-sedoheptulose 7-phosphate isomerase